MFQFSLCFWACFAALALSGIATAEAQSQPIRPPAVPLITHDPYFSVWSQSNNLFDDWPRHWTGRGQALCGLVRIDGKTYRYMGTPSGDVPAVSQKSVTVLPTRTIYVFETAGVEMTLTFLTPALPKDLAVYSRPLTYLVWDVRATDGKNHQVSLYLDATGELVVNEPSQSITWSRYQDADGSFLRMGTQDQPILKKSGDNLRIDWGYLYMKLPRDAVGGRTVAASTLDTRSTFIQSGAVTQDDDVSAPRPAEDGWVALVATYDLGEVGATPVSRRIMLAYDDIYSLEYFNRRLRPYWRRNGMDAKTLLKVADDDYAALAQRCKAFDDEVMADLRKTGGDAYAQMAALAYRQCVAAHKLAADWDGTPVLMSKENFSNGCINTVDLTYPSGPFFLLFNTELLKAQLRPILDYASSKRWPHPFAPHDMGTYPLANGQVYGGGERTEENQMPVEESGNMLILMAALAHSEGNAAFAEKYHPTLKKWAEYLLDKGLDPENQLCTDDFAGHLAHNANLSVKAIVALAGYGKICEMSGHKAEAAKYSKAAREMAAQWMKIADDGDHYRLAFDKPDSWSQKYNLVWDKLLGYKVFPAEVARKEVAYYKTKLQKYGLPLDSRRTYTKADWEIWTATLTDNRADFDALVKPVCDYVSATTDRVPLSDWYETLDARKVGFQARSVIGGVYIPLLADAATWKKWAAKTK